MSLLNLLCRCLERAEGNDQCTIADILDVKPLTLVRVAGRHLVTPHVAYAVASSNLQHDIDEDLWTYLTFVLHENQQRNLKLLVQLIRITEVLNTIGVYPTLLKGTARLADNLYQDMTLRFMRDIDILVPGERGIEAMAALLESGYRQCQDPSECIDHRHFPRIQKDGEPGIVEIHTEAVAAGYGPSAEQIITRSHSLELSQNAWVRMPSTQDQISILIGHDLADRYMYPAGSFVLRNVFELALLVQSRKANPAEWPGLPMAITACLFPRHVQNARPMRLRTGAMLTVELLDYGHRVRDLIDSMPGKRQAFGYLRKSGICEDAA